MDLALNNLQRLIYHKIQTNYHSQDREDIGLQNIPTAFLRRAKTPSKKCPGCDTKQSHGEAPVILEHWECRVSFHCHRSQVHSDQGGST